MSDPSPARVRHVLTSIGHGRVSGTALQDLMIGVGEAVSNARQHGRPPVTVRIWAGSGRILIHVHDTGPGPADPLAGLVPVWARPGRRGGGLWLIHMLGLDAALIRSPDGFTVRLAAGHPA
jgi:anti-sigma regulatory factor (Ser/Thr protein kinase)